MIPVFLLGCLAFCFFGFYRARKALQKLQKTLAERQTDVRSDLRALRNDLSSQITDQFSIARGGTLLSNRVLLNLFRSNFQSNEDFINFLAMEKSDEDLLFARMIAQAALMRDAKEENVRVLDELVDEHGHILLMKLLLDDLGKLKNLKGKNVVEIGTTREKISCQQSSLKIAQVSQALGMNFTTVDMDPVNSQECNRAYERLALTQAQAVTGRGEDFLRGNSAKIDYLYLDAFDFDHEFHSEKRKKSYEENLGVTISDELCWQAHLDMVQNCIDDLRENSLVVFDDTWCLPDGGWAGKGALAIPYLESNSFTIVEKFKKTVALRRSC